MDARKALRRQITRAFMPVLLPATHFARDNFVSGNLKTNIQNVAYLSPVSGDKKRNVLSFFFDNRQPENSPINELNAITFVLFLSIKRDLKAATNVSSVCDQMVFKTSSKKCRSSYLNF